MLTVCFKGKDRVVAVGGAAAHLWREADVSRLGQMQKTKAHRTMAKAEVAGDMEDFLGNFMADSLCKERAKGRLPEGKHIATLRGAQERCQSYLLYVARILGAWAEVQRICLAEVKAAGIRPLPNPRATGDHMPGHGSATGEHGCARVA